MTGKQDYYIKAELYPLADLQNKKEDSSKKNDEREEEKVLQASQLEDAPVKAGQETIEKDCQRAARTFAMTETTDFLGQREKKQEIKNRLIFFQIWTGRSLTKRGFGRQKQKEKRCSLT